MTADQSIEHRDIDVGEGLSLHVEISGHGPPLVLLHGFTGSTDTWAPFRPALDRTYRVIAIDQPGHGHSSSPPDPYRYRLYRFGDDLASLLDSLDVARSVILGYSMGGRAALRFAVDHPDRVAGLVLESTSPGILDSHERLTRRTSDSKLADDIERDGIESFVERWESLSLWDTQKNIPAETRKGLHQQRLASNARGLANSLRGAGAGEDPPIIEAAAAITVPTLVIAGALDQKYSGLARLIAQTIPGARAEIVEKSGHIVHLEQPEAFLAAVMGFLAQIPSDGADWTAPRRTLDSSLF